MIPPNPLNVGAISRETAAAGYRLFCKHPTQPHNLYDPTEGWERKTWTLGLIFWAPTFWPPDLLQLPQSLIS